MISASDVVLRIADRELLTALTFSIQPGEFVAILGPNGVGKTTLLRAVAGMHKLSAGTLEVNARPIDAYAPLERARQIALMVSEDLELESMSVRDAVAAGRYAHHDWWDWREHESDEDAIERALQAVHMSDLASRDFETLSTGERQRVWLAVGLAQEASVLLLDEPTSHLDIRHSREILNLLKAQASAGKTVACVLHDINEALEFADRIMVLGNGTMLALDTPPVVVANGALNTSYGIAFQAMQTADGTLRAFPS